MHIEFTVGSKKVALSADSMCWQLCELIHRKSGDTWEPFKYFASPAQALNRLIDMKLRASDATTIQQLAADLEAARLEVMEVWATNSKVA